MLRATLINLLIEPPYNFDCCASSADLSIREACVFFRPGTLRKSTLKEAAIMMNFVTVLVLALFALALYTNHLNMLAYVGLAISIVVFIWAVWLTSGKTKK